MLSPARPPIHSPILAACRPASLARLPCSGPAPCPQTNRLIVLALTFICYAAYHASRKPPSIVKSVLHGDASANGAGAVGAGAGEAGGGRRWCMGIVWVWMVVGQLGQLPRCSCDVMSSNMTGWWLLLLQIPWADPTTSTGQRAATVRWGPWAGPAQALCERDVCVLGHMCSRSPHRCSLLLLLLLPLLPPPPARPPQATSRWGLLATPATCWARGTRRRRAAWTHGPAGRPSTSGAAARRC